MPFGKGPHNNPSPTRVKVMVQRKRKLDLGSCNALGVQHCVRFLFVIIVVKGGCEW